MDVFTIADSALVDIILYFAEQVQNGVGPDYLPKIEKSLLRKGYSQKQIEEAIWLFHVKIGNRKHSNSVRIFSQQELSNFTPDAKRLFVRLCRLKVLTLEQIEAILWRTSIFSDEEVSVDGLKITVAMMLSQPDSEPIPPGFFILDKDEVQN